MGILAGEIKINSQTYQLTDVPIVGGNSIVFPAVASSGQPVAIKSLPFKKDVPLNVERAMDVRFGEAGDINPNQLETYLDLDISLDSSISKIRNRLFLVTNFIKGTSLNRLPFENKALTIDRFFEVLDLTKKMLKALSILTENKVVHGHPGPSNMILSPDKSEISFVDINLLNVSGQRIPIDISHARKDATFAPGPILGDPLHQKDDLYSVAATALRLLGDNSTQYHNYPYQNNEGGLTLLRGLEIFQFAKHIGDPRLDDENTRLGKARAAKILCPQLRGLEQSIYSEKQNPLQNIIDPLVALKLHLFREFIAKKYEFVLMDEKSDCPSNSAELEAKFYTDRCMDVKNKIEANIDAFIKFIEATTRFKATERPTLKNATNMLEGVGNISEKDCNFFSSTFS